MELVSPDSVSRDWREKYIEYEKAGVPEYWVIDRPAGRMETYALSRGGTYRRLEEQQGRLRSAVLRGFYLRPQWILADNRPRVGAVLREMGVRI
jgi:Uma2 family endonuclease